MASEKTTDSNVSQFINRLTLHNYRNFETFEINDLERFNLFVGPNAVGKTNTVEAIQLLTELSSFRHPLISDLMPFDQDSQTKICAEFNDGNFIQMTLTPDKKQYIFNGKRKNIVDIKGKYPAVLFNPDDLMLVKKGNSLRRQMIDSLGGQLSKNYYTVRKDYSRILRQKNCLLRDGASPETLLAINQVMALPAAQLTCFRWNLCNKMEDAAAKYYKKIAGNNEKLTMTYSPSISIENFDRDEVKNSYLNNFDQVSREEISSKHSISGPHKDKIIFKINGQIAEKFASQGQQRSIVLALKMAEVSLIVQILDKLPVLILDDVMSELDSRRREALLEFLPGNIQVFITTTNLNYFENSFLKKSKVINIQDK